MTQEDNLLFEYLCMALPYEVKFGIGSAKLGRYVLTYIDVKKEKVRYGNGLYVDLERCKPYLRSMSSMTEKEKEQLKSLYDAENVTNESICFLEGGTLEEYEAETSFVFCYCIVKWLLKHHFDFIGLIPKGLAIEVNESNNPYENNM